MAKKMGQKKNRTTLKRSKSRTSVYVRETICIKLRTQLHWHPGERVGNKPPNKSSYPLRLHQKNHKLLNFLFRFMDPGNVRRYVPICIKGE